MSFPVVQVSVKFLGTSAGGLADDTDSSVITCKYSDVIGTDSSVIVLVTAVTFACTGAFEPAELAFKSTCAVWSIKWDTVGDGDRTVGAGLEQTMLAQAGTIGRNVAVGI